MPDYRSFPNVFLGAETTVADFCVLGQPAKGRMPGQDPLRIGPNGVIRSHTVIYAGAEIGARVQTGHGTLIRERTTIGDDCSIGTGSVVEFAVVIGNRVRLHSQCFVPEYSVLEDDCWLGPRVVITNARYPASPGAKDKLEGVRICRFAKIGANVTLLPGVVIGPGALVGAGAVVTRDVAADTVVVGNPARPIRRASELEDEGVLVYVVH
jgi:acetyltransferase-like isoleucine patch superfamily enzyme